MNWTYLLLGFLVLGVVGMIYQLRNLTLNDIIRLLSMSPRERLAFANEHRFIVQTGGDNIPSLNFLTRRNWIANDWLFFPHDNTEIEEWNERKLFSLAVQGLSIEELVSHGHQTGLVKKTELDFVSYGLKSGKAKGIVKGALKKGFRFVEGNIFKKETLNKLGIKESDFGGFYSVHGENCEFYKNESFGLVHGRHSNGYEVFTIFGL